MSNDLWVTASADTERENTDRLFTNVRIEASQYWPFLSGADTEYDFSTRLALVASKLDEIVRARTNNSADYLSTRAALDEAFTKDFEVVAATYAQEKAERIGAERDAPFKATHTYSPIGWDSFDPKGVVGRPIPSGAPVELLKEHTKSLHQGMPPEAKQMFNVVRDAEGNRQHVNLKSLTKGASKTAGLGIGAMNDGDVHEFESEGRKHRVEYHSWQATGDDGKPARGYTKGEFVVHSPEGIHHFPHTPNGPTLSGAKAYAGEQAEHHIMRDFSDAKLKRMRSSSKLSYNTEAGDPLKQPEPDAFEHEAPNLQIKQKPPAFEMPSYTLHQEPKEGALYEPCDDCGFPIEAGLSCKACAHEDS